MLCLKLPIFLLFSFSSSIESRNINSYYLTDSFPGKVTGRNTASISNQQDFFVDSTFTKAKIPLIFYFGEGIFTGIFIYTGRILSTPTSTIQYLCPNCSEFRFKKYLHSRAQERIISKVFSLILLKRGNFKGNHYGPSSQCDIREAEFLQKLIEPIYKTS
uniref:Uncharacterized protein n=1 Tax=Methanosarcina barkeri (strain Fusaro / DSM 804) TaxID=269797 RepID=Q46DM5_METBF